MKWMNDAGRVLAVMLLGLAVPGVGAVEVHFDERESPVPTHIEDRGVSGNGTSGERGWIRRDSREASDSEPDPVRVVPFDTGAQERSQAHREAIEAGEALRHSANCPATETTRLRKRVAVSAFALIRKEDATMGGLQDVQRKLPQQLHAHLARDQDVIALSASERRIFRSAADFPTERQPDRSLTRASRLTRDMDAQFVVSGVVRDMSLANPDTWGTSKLHQWGRAFGRGDRERRFVVDLYVHDGLSGALVMEQRFETSGEWPFEADQRIGFGSREFDGSDYGLSIADLVEEMAREVTDRVACQPFMAQVQRVDDTRIRIASGAESGLRPGDELELYRSQSFLDQPDANPELRDTGQRMVVQQVQPQYASGELPIEGPRMNVQRGDVVVVW